nr:relaxase/mobilization nuclease domain-containing protein [Ruegeria atlantica]
MSRASPIKTRLGACFGRPEAVVKFVRKGGVQNGKELRRQIDYLVKRAEGVLDIRENGVSPLNAQEIEDTISEWHDGFTGKTNFGYTRHMIVSFPSDTPPDFAHSAGLEFADRVFGSGKFGDTWDYLSVFHNDTDNPHVHLIVNCRGVENGHWLKTGMTGEMNIDVLRSIQAEVANEFGIDMTATTRFERGLVKEVPTDTWQVQAGMTTVDGVPEVEIRAQEAARDMSALSLASISEQFAETSTLISDRIQQYAIQLIEGETIMVSQLDYLLTQADYFGDNRNPSYVSQPIMRELWDLRDAGGTIDMVGADLKARITDHINDTRDTEQSHPHLSALAEIAGYRDFRKSGAYVTGSERYVQFMNDHLGEDVFKVLDEQTTGILQSIADMERLPGKVENPELRTTMELQIGDLKAQVAVLRPYDAKLQTYMVDDNRYNNAFGTDRMDALEGPEASKWEAVKSAIVERAEGTGLDADLFLARFSSHENVSLGTSIDWRNTDEAVASAFFKAKGVGDCDVQAKTAVDELHQFAATKIREVAQEISHTHEQAVSRGHEDDGHSL